MSNIRPYVIINGVDSRTIQGLLITSLPPISKPAQRTLTETIDGRDGDSSIKLGYSAYDKSLGIALTFGYNVDDIIAFFNSEGTIIFSNEPDKLYNFEIFEQIDLEKLIRFKTGTVTIHTQPFKFSTTENPLEFTNKEFTVVNNGNINSRPNIVVTGEGLATMQINGKNAINIDFGDAEQTLLIDSEGMNAYHTENIKNVEAEITPKQDLHGYNSPWIDSDKVNKVPYLSRALAGTAERIGNYEYNKLVGGTVAFNQNCQVSQNALLENVATKAYSAGVWTFTASDLSSDSVGWYAEYPVKANHVCFIAVDVNPTNSVTMQLGMMDRTLFNVSGGTYTRIETLRRQDIEARPVCYAMLNGQGFNSFAFSCKNVNFIDLTQMLGASIADYIYSLEQANTGAGVAYFRALFSADYYPYNAGELMSVKATAHVTKKAGGAVIQTVALDPNLELRGVPKLDENNKLYYDGDTYSTDGSVSRRYGVVDLGSLNYTYDSSVPRFYTTGITDIIAGVDNEKANIISKFITIRAFDLYSSPAMDCIALSSGKAISITNSDYTDASAFKSSLSGVYLVYEKATPTSESAQAFTNPIEIDSNGSERLFDGNMYEIVNLGSLDYVYSDSGFTTQLPNNAKELNSNAEVLNCFCDMYDVISWNDATYNKQSGTIGTGISRYIVLYNSAYTDATAFKNAMNGVYLIYEKASSKGFEIPVGQESYFANICEIEGYSEVNLTRAGVNLFALNLSPYMPAQNIGVSINSETENTLSITSSNVAYACRQLFYELPAGIYTISIGNTTKTGTATPVISIYDYPNGTLIVNALSANNSVVFTLSEKTILDIRLFATANTAEINTVTFNNVQIELGSQASSYNSYAVEIFNKQFEQEGEPVTVYGGKYNFTTGLLEVTWGAVDLGTLNYQDAISSGIHYFYINSSQVGLLGMKNETYPTSLNIKAPIFTAKSNNNWIGGALTNDYEFCRNANNVCFRYDSISLPAEFKTAMNGMIFIYELAEPYFIELDPETISALLGINNFYADSGEVTITFVNNGQEETQTGLIVTFDLDESDFNKGDLANRLVSGNYDNIRLKAGANSIKFTGSVSAVGFNKYSRWL